MLLYLTVMVKPLIPIVSDWWQHEFNEMEHISHIHGVYGSHHLQHEIADTSSDNEHCDDKNTLKSEDQVAFHVLANKYKTDYNSTLSGNQFHLLKFLNLPSVFISKKGPPPKFT
jgi:hypothetical protein